MGIMAYSLLWIMQDFVHQPYVSHGAPELLSLQVLGIKNLNLIRFRV